MEMLFMAIFLGLLPGYIAHSKGKSFALWWTYGSLLFLIALPHALLTKKDQGAIESRAIAEGMKKCPNCAELIKSEAIQCRYCGTKLELLKPSRGYFSRDEPPLLPTTLDVVEVITRLEEIGCDVKRIAESTWIVTPPNSRSAVYTYSAAELGSLLDKLASKSDIA
jgi:hypothetical protein